MPVNGSRGFDENELMSLAYVATTFMSARGSLFSEGTGTGPSAYLRR